MQDTANEPFMRPDPSEVLHGEEAPDAAPLAGAEPIFVGGVEGRLSRVSVAHVQSVVGEVLTKIAAGLRTPAVAELKLLMQATDARSAPVYLTTSPRKPDALFAGLEALAAAMQLGLGHMFVITVPSSEASRLQAALVAERNRRQAPSDEDELLLYQVHHYYGS